MVTTARQREWILLTAVLALAGTAMVHGASNARHSTPATGATLPARDLEAVLGKYCVGCHNDRLKSGDLVLASKDVTQIGTDRETWERVARKLRARAMPPVGSPRPEAATLQRVLATVEDALDRGADRAADPGRPPIHRLNRLEYANAIRDLLGVEIDGRTVLPADDSGYGFDNIADVLTVSPGLFERYMLAAAKISRLAVEDPTMRPKITTYEVPGLSLAQNDRMSEDLPFGSRGGMAVRHHFPLDGEYELRFHLQRNDLINGYAIRGLSAVTQIDVRVDHERIKMFTLGGVQRPGHSGTEGDRDPEYPEEGLAVRFHATAGMRVIGVTMNQDVWKPEGVAVGQLPLMNNAYAQGRDSTVPFGRVDAGIEKIQITGPFDGKAPGDSPIGRRVFICRPGRAADEEPCARKIVERLARLAYRRPVTAAEAATLMDFYRRARKEDGTFGDGIQAAIGWMIVEPSFLFRLERDPGRVKPGAAYELADLELASRLSFFLWSSIPDDELLTVAERGLLKNPAVLDKQVRRMLSDERADAFVESFFGQWLTIRNVASAHPDPKVFPEFDESLRKAFLQETYLFLQSQIREDRPAPELLSANHTFVNERLARHYGIPGVIGNHFRRVRLPDSARAGLLGHGSLLTVTSYNDRTSVVVRGKFILATILGTPPPPPPADVPPLENTKIEGSLRQRMQLHRKNPVCASCHNTIDPLGFAFENFNGVGRFRTTDGQAPVDPSGVLADGTKFDGPAAFRQALIDRQDAFLGAVTKNLLTYAVGRGVELHDMPAVRKILRDAQAHDYRWSAIITSVVKSVPFRMRSARS